MMRYLTALLAACLSVATFAFDVPCLDPLACNFMEEGECFFTDENGDPCVIQGCTIEGACNYDPEADIYDGSCEFVSCLGCTDSEACNYDETALYDDASCIYYVDCNGTCGGDWIEDACGNCYSPETTIITEFTLTNCGNSGRIGPTQDMCDAQYGVNVVIVEDGMQHWTVPITGFYQFTASGAQGGSLTDWGMGATITAEFFLSAGEILKIGIGQMGSLACAGGGEAAGGGGGSTGVSNMQTGELLLLAAGGGGQGRSQFESDQWSTGSSELFGQSTYSDIGQLVANGGIDGMGGESGSNPHNDWPQAGGGAGVLSDGADGDGGGGGIAYGGRANGLGGGYTNGNDCRAEGGFGYTGGGASEYGGGGGGGYSGGGGGASAGASDLVYINGGGGGSFVHSSGQEVSITAGANAGHGLVIITWEAETSPICNPGCTYPQACNYNPESNFDDGSCDYCFCGEGTQWVDSLQACMVTEVALMQACGEGTYWDDLAQACLTIETCQEDLDGDGVIGVNDLLELLSSFGSECVPATAEWTCGDPVNYHGYDYATVQIGEQCWFAENLRTETYRNGDTIPSTLSDSEWIETTSGGATIYGEGNSYCGENLSPDGNTCDETWSLTEYGRLYNWYSVIDGRSLCPGGWHVPEFDEWSVMDDLVDDVANKLKTTYGWHNNGSGSNESGFSGLPGGLRGGYNGGFSTAGHQGAWWTSSSGDGDNSAWEFWLRSDEEVLGWSGAILTNGLSVRCVQDSE